MNEPQKQERVAAMPQNAQDEYGVAEAAVVAAVAWIVILPAVAIGVALAVAGFAILAGYL